MSSLRSKTRVSKCDKQSIKLRNELEQLTRKSKDEYGTLKESEKTELRESLLAPKPNNGSEKTRNFANTVVTHAKGSSPEVEELEACPVLTESLVKASKVQSKPPNPPSSPRPNIKKVGSGKVKVKSSKGGADLKTKTRLYEKGVVSIRADNPELKVVMQGRKVKKAIEEKTDEKKLETDHKFDELFLQDRPLSPVNIPDMIGAPKIAIMGSQNTSIPASLAHRTQPGRRGLNSAASFDMHGLEDDAFMFHWSSEGSESRVTSPCDEDRRSPPFAAGIKKEGAAIVSERSDHLKDENVGPTFSEGEKTEGMELNASENKVKVKVPIEEGTVKLNGGVNETHTLKKQERFQEDAVLPSTDHFVDKKDKLDMPVELQHVDDTNVNKLNGAEDEEDNGAMCDEEALQELSLPLKVTVSDVVNVSGKKAALVEKPSNLHQNKYFTVVEPQSHASNDVTLLSTWQEARISTPIKTGRTSSMKIHHFCFQNTTVELPAHLRRVSRDMHTVDKHRVVAQRYQTTQEPLPRVLPISETFPRFCKHVELDEELEVAAGEYVFERGLSEVAEDILINAANQAEILQRLQSTADQMFEGNKDEPLNIHGVKIDLKDDSTRYYWTPAPPKLHLTPSFVRDHMFPGYQGAPVFKDTLGTEYGTIETTNDDSEDDEDDLDKLDPEDREAHERVLQRTHGSMSNIMDQLSRKPVKTEKQSKPSETQTTTLLDVNQEEEGGTGERFLSVMDLRRQMAKIKDSLRIIDTEARDDDAKWFSNLYPQRRPESQPDLSNELSLCVESDYHTSMQELEEQTALVSAIKLKKKSPEYSEKHETSPKPGETHEEKRDSFDCSFSLNTDSVLQDSGTDRKEDGATETNSVVTTTSRAAFAFRRTGKALQRGYPFGRRKTRKECELGRSRRKKKIQKRIQELLDKPPRTIKRSESLHSLSRVRSLTRSNSVPCFMDYKSLNKENMSEGELFSWVQDEYWYKWFDEVYPPSSAAPDILQDMMSSLSAVTDRPSSYVSANVLDEIEVIEPHVDETSRQLYEDLEKEAQNVSEWIDQTESKETLALYLARRGAIYRKLGQLKKAWDDLERSIELEPQLLDSRWHRHLLYLLNNKPKGALEDLTYIIKKNSNCGKAYMSRAEIYNQQGDTTMAIVNYSQAIKLNPHETEIYYRRASVFEQRGDIFLALEDYKVASELLPRKTEAMFNIGRYHFNQKNWPVALKSFTTMLKQDPLDAKAYLYRGKAWANQGAFDDSIKDLSCAIHLDPRNAECFYHRGCLLRKVHPQKALQDLSVSLLLDSSNENVNAFLHRGIIYTDLKRWDEAVSDFESALRLNKCIPSAYVNVGLILITKHGNYARAIKRFSAAIRVDPTYVRGYVCRADAYDKTGHLNESVNDYTKAIHLRPDVSDYHMSRGKILLKQNKLELASFHIRQAAELSQGLGGSATQQAVVHAFLKDFDRAVDMLTKASRINPSAPMFILLGKTCMKAKQYENAIASFKRAVFTLTPWHPRISMPVSAATVYFSIGTCYTELENLHSALDAFNNAIKVNPEDAEAYYNRGLTKMKLRHAKSIHDFNRALAINPKLFQAFLSRAAYYGMKGRFSKGIMNCNEAIKLQPKSVRAYLYRGALKYHISAFKLAVLDLTEAIAIDCTCSLAYFNRAVCYQAMKFYQKALIDYSIVLLSSKEPDLKVLQNRGLLYLDINDTENALKDFSKAAKVSPNDPKVLHTLGLCYHKLNRLQDAVSSFTEALQVNPFFIEAFIGRGNALMDYGHSTATYFGRCDYLKALHLDPSYLPARVNLAYNLQVENKFQQAWHQFTCALSINKDCQAALEGRAIVNLQMGNTFGAFVDMNNCLKVSKTAELLTNRGVVQQFMGDTVNAVRDYQAAIELEPSYSLAYYNAANLYFKQRQFKQALVYYDKASSWNPQDESAVLNAAITKVLLKQFDSALCSFEKAVELSPNSAHIYFNRGNVYASLGQYEKAENDYTTALQLYPGDALTYKRRADVRGKMSRREEAIEDYKKAIIIQTRKRQK